MKRRAFLTAAGTATMAGAATAAASFPAPAIAQGKRELRMVTTWPKNFPGLGTGAQRLADSITQATDGQVSVKVFAAGELVPAFESFDAVSGGSADLYHAADYYWQGKAPAFAFFTTVPFGLTANEFSAWYHHGGGRELWDELSSQFNIKPFMAGNTSVQTAGWFRQPIESLDDLKGLKFRTPGLGGEVMRRVGASVVNIPGGEIFQALQSGAIDAAEWVGPWNDLAFGLHKITKHYYYPGYQEPGPALSCGINLDVWNDLGSSHQAAIEATCHAETNVSLAEFNARNGGALNTLVNEHGVQLHRFSDDILKALAEASADVLSEVAKEDDLTRRIHDSYLGMRSQVRPWSRIGEQAFLAARELVSDNGG